MRQSARLKKSHFHKQSHFPPTRLSPESNQLGERPESIRVKFYHRVSLEQQGAEAFHMAEGSRGHLVGLFVCLSVCLFVCLFVCMYDSLFL